ncbi:SAG family member [Eimeria necatrix]|uniref:SAG family member n=1 Tax=Eimeria necatrix TaxID=51315 RepID=U6MJA4_9EIME|nr:SAG family member [Eimeria necatrix]CDJ63153.1 SAG family member [Eimeria necatrix]
MLRLWFIAPVVMSVFCGHKTDGATTTGTAQTLDCTTEMNELRKAAGLSEFEKASKETEVLPEYPGPTKTISAENLWKQTCQKLMGEDVQITEAASLVGTVAHYAGAKDCKEAVQYWKDGFSLFKNELPPKYTALGEPEIYTDRAVSFVALYNPKASPVASCVLVTCTKGAAVDDAEERSRRHDSPPLRRLQDGAQTKTAVICLTNPDALTSGTAPFEEDEWQKIVDAIVGLEESSRASPISPSLAVGFIVTIFAHGLL